MQAVDRSLFLFINGLHHPLTDGFWLFMTSNWAWLFFFVPVGYWLFTRLGKKGIYPALCVALLFLLADQGTNVAKYFFARPRPCLDEELKMSMHFLAPYCGTKGSFWSAHAANVIAQITFFIGIGLVPITTRKLVYPYFFLFGFLVALSRIMVGVHYPFDILVGSVYGFFCGVLVLFLYRWLTKKLLIHA